MLPFAKISVLNDTYVLYFVGTIVIATNHMDSWPTALIYL